jgi:hypothetical protein
MDIPEEVTEILNSLTIPLYQMRTRPDVSRAAYLSLLSEALLRAYALGVAQAARENNDRLQDSEAHRRPRHS